MALVWPEVWARRTRRGVPFERKRRRRRNGQHNLVERNSIGCILSGQREAETARIGRRKAPPKASPNCVRPVRRAKHTQSSQSWKFSNLARRALRAQEADLISLFLSSARQTRTEKSNFFLPFSNPLEPLAAPKRGPLSSFAEEPEKHANERLMNWMAQSRSPAQSGLASFLQVRCLWIKNSEAQLEKRVAQPKGEEKKQCRSKA